MFDLREFDLRVLLLYAQVEEFRHWILVRNYQMNTIHFLSVPNNEKYRILIYVNDVYISTKAVA